MSFDAGPPSDNPYAAPALPAELIGGDEGGVYRYGKLLLVHKRATLPIDVCIKSNTPASRTLRRKFTWHHPAIYLALLANVLIYIILAVVLSKRAQIEVGLSDGWHRRRRIHQLFSWAMFLLAIAGFAAAVMEVLPFGSPGSVALILGSLVVLLISLVSALQGGRFLYPQKITDEYLVLKGTHADYRDRFPPWPHPLP